jgi:hypothetical protein
MRKRNRMGKLRSTLQRTLRNESFRKDWEMSTLECSNVIQDFTKENYENTFLTASDLCEY